MAKLLRLLAVCAALAAGQGNDTEPPTTLLPEPTTMTPAPTTVLLNTTSVPTTTTPLVTPATTPTTTPVATATPRPTMMAQTTLAPTPETADPERADTVGPTLEPNTSVPTATIQDATSGAVVLWPLVCGIVGCGVAIASVLWVRQSRREKPPSPVASSDSSVSSFFSLRNGPSDLGATNELLRSTNPIFDVMDSVTMDPPFETCTESAYSLSPSFTGGNSISTTHSTLLNSSYSEDIYCSVLSDRLLLTGGPSELLEEDDDATPPQLGDDDRSSLYDDDDDEDADSSSAIRVLHSGYGVDMAALQDTSSLSPYMDTTRFQAMLDTPVYLGQNDV
ncbi:hypothetical protein SPRG_16615 [Saprolegnia parasitica CBS 223.65]|uniref:Uncharacterized protein n=1 Tax=Saprolegnia parasitica (strain CBS 223.65) TaxID=695850 RepID=A0A067BTK9_SAPPC|nr:hypothetical protein SPRG_16615 [Saprolegnia parasitica CBS 223.65]KDO17982.1 hypothetical protein SPRG_16615 [Saprolegnia parasitica CBS 223.65]|eukprot:XP_012211311.1 hypothetical protein SPRG_16615 [Saprolegnia parasitica CBS 223.65]